MTVEGILICGFVVVSLLLIRVSQKLDRLTGMIHDRIPEAEEPTDPDDIRYGNLPDD